MDSCYSGWTSIRPESDAESFTQRSRERQELFERVAGPSRSIKINPVLWAFLQIADIDEAKEQMGSERATNTMLLTHASAVDAARLWKQHPEAKNETPSGILSTKTFSSDPMSPSALPPITTTIDDSRTRSKRKRGGQESSLGRSRLVAARCKERDGDLCAVSRMEAIDAAHIYPWCAFGDKGTKRVKEFWQVLKMFWKKEVVNEWQRKIFVDENTPYRGTETVANMISLTSTLHRFHSDGAFALRPFQISDDKKQLELEFHWLVMEDRKPGTEINLLDRPQSTQS